MHTKRDTTAKVVSLRSWFGRLVRELPRAFPCARLAWDDAFSAQHPKGDLERVSSAEYLALKN